MDLIYRKEKYREYLRRLNQLKEDNDYKAHINELREGINAVLNDLRDKSDIAQVHMYYAILLIPILVVLIWSGIQSREIGWPFIPLVLLVTFFVVANLLMKNVIASNIELKWKGEISENNERSFLQYKIEYLKTGLRVKTMRMTLLQTFYFVFFPFLLVFLYRLIQNTDAFGHIAWDYIIAFAMSAPAWWFFFKRDRENQDEIYDVINRFETALLSMESHEGQ